MPNQFDDLAKLHGRLRELKAVCARIGQLPEHPSSVRGKVGASLVSVVRRMLFWYTPPLRATLEGLAQVVDDLIQSTGKIQESLEQQIRKAGEAPPEPDLALLEQRVLDRVLAQAHRDQLDSLQELNIRLKAQGEVLQQERLRNDRLEETLQQERLKREEVENRLRENGETLLRECLRSDELEKGLRAEQLCREGLQERMHEQGLRINGREDYWQTQTESLAQERHRITEMFQQERICTIELEGRLREQVDSVQQLQEDRQSEEYANRLQKAEERLQMLRRELVEHSQRVSRLLEEARKRLPAPLDREQLEAFGQEDLHDLDSLYAAFEDAVRGPREEVREHLKSYLPLLQKARDDRNEFAVLDLGCGRGEWLDLLRQEGFMARGVDFNRSMVEECRDQQLDVENDDVLEYLNRIRDASVGAVTVFHMVEHLPFRKLIRLLDEVTRVLQPGGLAIFETPNPHNLSVGASGFYLDPTRRHPIPDETLRFLVESRGLCQVKVMPLNPCNPCNHIPEGKEGSALVRRFNEYFYGPQDYAVIGRKV